jgi:uncharacterized protein (TIGR02594 family)
MNFTRKHLAVTFFASVAVAAVGVQANAKPRKSARVVADAPVQTVVGSDRMPMYLPVDQVTPARSARTASKRARRAATGAAKVEPVAAKAFASSDLVSEARRYLGGNPTGRGSEWCGAFMDMVLKRTGRKGGGNLASAYAKYGTRVAGPQIGAIAVMPRRGGGHVGVVSGIDSAGNPIIISGNHNRKVAESVYPRGRITAYVVP